MDEKKQDVDARGDTGQTESTGGKPKRPPLPSRQKLPTAKSLPSEAQRPDTQTAGGVQQAEVPPTRQASKGLPEGIAVANNSGGINVLCPSCEAKLKFNPQLAGRPVRCSKCTKQFRFPTDIQPAISAAKEAKELGYDPNVAGTVPCPKCRRGVQYHPAIRGKAIDCPHCARSIRLGVVKPFREQLMSQFGSSGSAGVDIGLGLTELIYQPVLYVMTVVLILPVLVAFVDGKHRSTVLEIGIPVALVNLALGIMWAIYRLYHAASRAGTRRLTDRPLKSAAERDQLIDELSSALEDDTVEVVAEALRELARIGSDAVRALPSITALAKPGKQKKCVDGSTISIGHEALATLTAIGPAAIPAIEDVLKKESKKNILVRDFGFVKRAKAALKTAKSMRPVTWD